MGNSGFFVKIFNYIFLIIINMKKFSKVLGIFTMSLAMAATANANTIESYIGEIIPSNKKTVTELPGEIHIHWTGVWNASSIFQNDAAVVRFYTPDGSVKKIQVEESSCTDEGNYIDMPINLGETYTQKGQYTLTFPANTFYLGYGNTVDVPFTIEWYVDPSSTPGGDTGEEVPDNISITPSPGMYHIDALVGQANISASDFHFTASSFDNLLTMTDPDGNVTNIPLEVGKKEVTENDETVEYPDYRRLVFNLTEDMFKKSGDYTFSAKFADTQTQPANYGKDFKWVYNVTGITGTDEANVAISPASGEKDALPMGIEITFKDAKNVYTQFGVNNPVANVTGPDGYTATLPVSTGKSNVVSIYWASAPTVAGVYELTMDPKQFTNESGVAFNNPLIKWSYTLKDAGSQPTEANVSISPSDKNVKALPEKITVKFNDATYVFGSEGTNAVATVTGPEGYNVTLPAKVGTMTNVVTIDWNNAPTVAGTYEWTLDPKQFANEEGDAFDNLPIKWSYNLEGQTPVEPAVAYTITPDVNETYDEVPTKVTVTYDCRAIIRNNGGSKWEVKVRLENEKYDINEEIATDANMKDGKFDVTFDVPNGYTDPGAYKFTVLFDGNYDAYQSDGTKLPLVNTEFTYNVGGITSRVVPAAGQVEKLDVVTITITSAETVTLDQTAGTVTFKNGIGEDLPFAISAEGNVITVDLNNEVTADGSYRLAIPANVIVADGVAYDKAMYISYTIKATGIESILVEGEESDVYGIDGRIVVRKGDKESLRNLEKGIYVVKGRKVLVK